MKHDMLLLAWIAPTKTVGFFLADNRSPGKNYVFDFNTQEHWKVTGQTRKEFWDLSFQTNNVKK